jgi:hypothetical protein
LIAATLIKLCLSLSSCKLLEHNYFFAIAR